MNGLTHYIQEGGAMMYPVMCFGIIGVALALASLGSLFAPSRKFPIGVGIAAMLIGLMALGTGMVGTMLGRRTTDEVLTMVEPDQAELIRAQGYEEADNNLVFGGIASLAPLLAGMLAVARGVTMKTPEKG